MYWIRSSHWNRGHRKIKVEFLFHKRSKGLKRIKLKRNRHPDSALMASCWLTTLLKTRGGCTPCSTVETIMAAVSLNTVETKGHFSATFTDKSVETLIIKSKIIHSNNIIVSKLIPPGGERVSSVRMFNQHYWLGGGGGGVGVGWESVIKWLIRKHLIFHKCLNRFCLWLLTPTDRCIWSWQLQYNMEGL